MHVQLSRSSTLYVIDGRYCTRRYIIIHPCFVCMNGCTVYNYILACIENFCLTVHSALRVRLVIYIHVNLYKMKADPGIGLKLSARLATSPLFLTRAIMIWRLEWVIAKRRSSAAPSTPPSELPAGSQCPPVAVEQRRRVASLRAMVVKALHRGLAARRLAPCRCPACTTPLRAPLLPPAAMSATASPLPNVRGPCGALLQGTRSTAGRLPCPVACRDCRTAQRTPELRELTPSPCESGGGGGRAPRHGGEDRVGEP